MEQEMEQMVMEASAFDVFGLLMSANILGIVIGIISIVLLWKTSQQLGGRIQTALSFLLAGLVAMTLSFGITIWVIMAGAMNPTTMALHHSVMVMGMILFVLAGKSFISFTKIP